jgi:ElaB/YqjD/DUF883 family membrane-anchored ribosome-binding protein
MDAEKKINYTSQPFSPNDKPSDFASFDPKRDVRNVGNRWLYPSDSEHDTYFQINKLPTGVWGDYSEYIEGLIARTARMYERPFNSANRSEIAHEGWQIAGTAAIGGIIGAIPGMATHYVCHNIFNLHNPQLTELLTHVVTTTGIIGGMHAANEIMLSSHDNQRSSETEAMLTQARNQGKKTQVEVIEWRERTNDPKAAELEAQLDEMIRSYENAFELTEQSTEHAPWWKVSATAMAGGFIGAIPGALTYVAGKKSGVDEETLRFVSGAIATTGMIAGMHAVTEIMRPQHINTTSRETAEELFNARNLVRKNYADAVELRRSYESEPTPPSPQPEISAQPNVPDSISMEALEQYRQKALENPPSSQVTSIQKQSPIVEVTAHTKHAVSV